jgi:hypothetical protein
MSFYRESNQGWLKKCGSRSTYLNHLFEDWFEVLGAAEHERIHSQAQLAILVSNGPWHTGCHSYREAPFRLPQILEGVVMTSGLLDIILDVVLVRHGV